MPEFIISSDQERPIVTLELVREQGKVVLSGRHGVTSNAILSINNDGTISLFRLSEDFIVITKVQVGESKHMRIKLE